MRETSADVRNMIRVQMGPVNDNQHTYSRSPGYQTGRNKNDRNQLRHVLPLPTRTGQRGKVVQQHQHAKHYKAMTHSP